MPYAGFLLLAAAPSGVWGTLLEILLLLGAAMAFGFVAERLRQSAIVGYLIAGTVVGPNALGWVTSQEHLFTISELGVALLLFTIGLEFSPQELLKLGRVPLISGPLQVVVTMLVSAGAGIVLGLPAAESFVIGAMVALSSTACVLRVLRDRAEIDSPYGRVCLGILLVQDAAVVPLVLIVTALSGGGSVLSISLTMLVSIGLAIALIAVFYVLFNWVIPRVLIMPTWRRNRDLPVLLTVCIVGGAAWASHAVGLSPALGSFVAGMLLAVSPFATQIQADIQPLRAVLVTLFFAAIGMFGDVGWFVNNLGLVGAIALVIVLGKAAIIVMVTRHSRFPLQFSVAAGLCLAQIGEFSFVLATIARNETAAAGLLSESTFRALVSATIVSLLLTPYLVALAPRIGGWVERTWRKARPAPARDAPAREESPDSGGETLNDAVLIVGFGPAGQRVAEDLLRDYGARLTVIDLNPDNIEVAQRYGLRAHIGDAMQTDVLEHAGIHRASVAVVTIPNPTQTLRVIQHIRHIAPLARILVRSRYHIHQWGLLQAGADIAIDEESQVGQRLAREARAMLHRIDESGRTTPAAEKPT